MSELDLQYSRTVPNDNLAYDTRRDNDEFIVPSITLEDIDYAIMYHLQNNMGLTIVENGRIVPVPVTMAYGETWAQIQKNGFMRGQANKIVKPQLVIKRESMMQDDRLMNLKVPNIGAGNSIKMFPKQQKNNQHDWIHKTYNTEESKEFYISVIPDFIKVSYTLYIWTDLMVQMNSIIEEIIQHDKRPWGDSFTFNSQLQDAQFETLNDAQEDRVIRATIPLDVDGRLNSEYKMKQSNVQKAFGIKRVDFLNEIEQVEIYPDFLPKIIRPGRSRIPGNFPIE